MALRSMNFPDKYLSHQNFEIKIRAAAGPNDSTWMQDTTFQVVSGLADPSGISLRSVNYPDWYIRHRNFKLFLEAVDTPIARADATFHRID